MKILGLEFSASRRSAAVIELGDGQTALASISEEGRSTRPFEMIERVLGDANVEREEIRLICLGLGPGSYAGIRIAIAIAQGWELALSVELAGISSIQAMADALAMQPGADGERFGVAVDAQRGEAYLAIYQRRRGRAVVVHDLQLTGAQDLAQHISDGTPVFGPDLGAFDPRIVPLYPDALTVARLAADSGVRTPGEALEPIYLRPVSFVKAPPPRRL